MTAPRADDTAFMRRALQLAARGRGRVEPNPMVGCVIVHRGRIIAEGYHHRFGGPHAEIEALRHCRHSPQGATAYVSLEPCCYHGKTPPCTAALVAAGVKRVVAAVRDPNPRVAGRGVRILRAAGIDVELGVLGSEAAALNAPFTKLVRQGRPWVILKWAQSVDGKIATRTGDSKWITDHTMRAHAHRVRGRVDAVLVGVGTARTDDPLLTCRVGRPRRVATRVVLDSQLRISPQAKLVQTARHVPTWIFCRHSARGAARLEAAGCRVHRVAADARGVSLTAVLNLLGRHQMTNLLVEGGGTILGSFFDQQLGDELHMYVAPRLIGGKKATGALDGRGVNAVSDAAAALPPEARLRRLGSGWLLQARLDRRRRAT